MSHLWWSRDTFHRIFVKGTSDWEMTSTGLGISSVISVVCHVKFRPWSMKRMGHHLLTSHVIVSWPLCKLLAVVHLTVSDKKFCRCIVFEGSALCRQLCAVAFHVCQWLCLQRLLASQAFNLIMLYCTSRHRQADGSNKRMQIKLRFGVWSILCGMKSVGRNEDAFVWNQRLSPSRWHSLLPWCVRINCIFIF